MNIKNIYLNTHPGSLKIIHNSGVASRNVLGVANLLKYSMQQYFVWDTPFKAKNEKTCKKFGGCVTPWPLLATPMIHKR